MSDTPDQTLYAHWSEDTPDQTLYAHWELSQTVVVFDAMGGVFGTDNSFKVVDVGAAIGTLPVVTRQGATFVGWYTAPTGGTEVTAATVAAGEMMRVYARWSFVGQTRTLYFNAAGGVCATTSKSMTVGSAVGTLPVATKTGYVFAGWFRSTVGADEVTSATLAPDVNLTVYAHWTPITLTLTFNANGGTVSEQTRNIPYGAQYRKLPTPVRIGYNFLGWYTAATGGNSVNSRTVATESRTLYAHWSKGSADYVILR